MRLRRGSPARLPMSRCRRSPRCGCGRRGRRGRGAVCRGGWWPRGVRRRGSTIRWRPGAVRRAGRPGGVMFRGGRAGAARRWTEAAGGRQGRKGGAVGVVGCRTARMKCWAVSSGLRRAPAASAVSSAGEEAPGCGAEPGASAVVESMSAISSARALPAPRGSEWCTGRIGVRRLCASAGRLVRSSRSGVRRVSQPVPGMWCGTGSRTTTVGAPGMWCRMPPTGWQRAVSGSNLPAAASASHCHRRFMTGAIPPAESHSRAASGVSDWSVQCLKPSIKQLRVPHHERTPGQRAPPRPLPHGANRSSTLPVPVDSPRPKHSHHICGILNQHAGQQIRSASPSRRQPPLRLSTSVRPQARGVALPQHQ